MRKQPEHVTAAEAEAAKWGGVFTFEICRHSIKGTVTYGGKSLPVTLSKTPSDWRAPQKVRNDVRRVMRKLAGVDNLKTLNPEARQ